MTHSTDAVKILVEILQNNAASAHDIRGFIVDDQAGMRLLTELPDPEGQRIAAYAHDAVWILHRHGTIDAAWLARLEHKYPHEGRAINDVRRILSLPTRIERPSRSTSSPTTGLTRRWLNCSRWAPAICPWAWCG